MASKGVQKWIPRGRKWYISVCHYYNSPIAPSRHHGAPTLGNPAFIKANRITGLNTIKHQNIKITLRIRQCKNTVYISYLNSLNTFLRPLSQLSLLLYLWWSIGTLHSLPHEHVHNLLLCCIKSLGWSTLYPPPQTPRFGSNNLLYHCTYELWSHIIPLVFGRW